MDAAPIFDTKFIDPEAVLSQIGIKPGAVVADFGCGAGYFSVSAARKIGQDGIIYSFDVLAEKIESVESQARQAGLTNIIARRANLEKENGSGLENESADLVIVKDMLFQNKNKRIILHEAERILKKNGMALIIEWDMKNFSIGPKKELRVSKEEIIELASSSRLRFRKEINAGDFHCGLVFEK